MRRSFHSSTVQPPGLTNADELAPRLLAIKPVGRLGGGDEVDAVIGESGRFCGSLHAGEMWIGAQKFLAGLAHVGIRFDAEHAIAILQQHAGEDAGAGGNIGDDGSWG